jgi:hypothetical protein
LHQPPAHRWIAIRWVNTSPKSCNEPPLSASCVDWIRDVVLFLVEEGRRTAGALKATRCRSVKGARSSHSRSIPTLVVARVASYTVGRCNATLTSRERAPRSSGVAHGIGRVTDVPHPIHMARHTDTLAFNLSLPPSSTFKSISLRLSYFTTPSC